MMTRSGASCSVRSGSGDKVSGGWSSAAAELWPRACKREGGREGFKSGAHCEVREKLGGLGGVLRAANRRRWWSEPDGEDDGGVGVVARPGPHGSMERIDMGAADLTDPGGTSPDQSRSGSELHGMAAACISGGRSFKTRSGESMRGFRRRVSQR